MAKYKVKYATVSVVSRTVPFNGLTMRDIYSRFVITGQRPVEIPGAVSTSEDDPYDPSQDAFSRAAAAAASAVESIPEETQAPEVEKTE